MDIVEFLTLLGTECDIDGGGVGLTDFMKVMDHWGPCPQCKSPDDCDDGDPCTIDACVDGECVSSPAEGNCCSDTGCG